MYKTHEEIVAVVTVYERHICSRCLKPGLMIYVARINNQLCHACEQELHAQEEVQVGSHTYMLTETFLSDIAHWTLSREDKVIGSIYGNTLAGWRVCLYALGGSLSDTLYATRKDAVLYYVYPMIGAEGLALEGKPVITQDNDSSPLHDVLSQGRGIVSGE